jgi:AcrR family transcriptional regulator
MKAEQRKKLILENAKRLFSKKGYYNTQISDIVDEVKVARGTVYQYFKNKDEIFLTLLKDFYNTWERHISNETSKLDLRAITPVDYFYLRVRYTLEVLANDPDLCNIVLRMGIGLSGGLETTIKRFEKRIHNLVSQDLNLGIRYHHVRKDLNVQMASNLITGALLRTALSDFAFRRKRRTPEEINTLAREITNIFAPAIFVNGALAGPKLAGQSDYRASPTM